LKDLARGEQAAAAMENHLDSLERKIEELLAKADEDEKKLNAQPKASEKSPATEDETNDT
jgi:exonuclease VII small subunit